MRIDSIRKMTGPLLALVLGATFSAESGAIAGAPPWELYDALLGDEANTFFGLSVSADNRWLVVGMPYSDVGQGTPLANAGRVRIYQRNPGGDGYALTAELISQQVDADAFFGYSVAIWGNRLVIGAPGHAGLGRIEFWSFNETLSQWQFENSFGSFEAFGFFGSSVAISGGRAAASLIGHDIGMAANAGRVVLYERDLVQNRFVFVDSIDPPDPKPSGSFGRGLAILDFLNIIGGPADRLIVGEPGGGTGSGAAWAFERSGGAFAFSAKFNPPAGMAGHSYGWNVATSGARIYVGAVAADRVSYHERNSVGWLTFAPLTAPSPGAQQLGFGRALSAEGNRVLIGHADPDDAAVLGRAYLFEADAATGAPQHRVRFNPPSGTGEWNSFGLAAALDWPYATVTAPLDDVDALVGAGKGAYYFERGVFFDSFEVLQ